MYVNFLFHISGDHVNDANISDSSVHTIKQNTEAFVIACKETGLEVNADKPKDTDMSRNQNAGRSHSMKIDNCYFERVEQFRYLRKTLTN